MSTEVMVPNPAPTGRPALVARKPSRAGEVAREVVRILVLVAILAVVLYPLVWVVGSSFKSQTEIARNISVLPEEFSPQNYSIGWTSLGTSFGWFFVNSVVIAGLTVVGNVASCILAA